MRGGRYGSYFGGETPVTGMSGGYAETVVVVEVDYAW
jgi:hypothetical protein